MTPGWWRPINPDTLAVSDREFCVFAQAKHEFKSGIIQVADAAVKQGIKGVRLLKGKDLGKITGFQEGRWDSFRLEQAEEELDGIAIDVFYYGFDVDAKLRSLTSTYDGGKGPWLGDFGSRREAWAVLDEEWHKVVVAKKQADGSA